MLEVAVKSKRAPVLVPNKVIVPVPENEPDSVPPPRSSRSLETLSKTLPLLVNANAVTIGPLTLKVPRLSNATFKVPPVLTPPRPGTKEGGGGTQGSPAGGWSHRGRRGGAKGVWR